MLEKAWATWHSERVLMGQVRSDKKILLAVVPFHGPVERVGTEEMEELCYVQLV